MKKKIFLTLFIVLSFSASAENNFNKSSFQELKKNASLTEWTFDNQKQGCSNTKEVIGDLLHLKISTNSAALETFHTVIKESNQKCSVERAKNQKFYAVTCGETTFTFFKDKSFCERMFKARKK